MTTAAACVSTSGTSTILTYHCALSDVQDYGFVEFSLPKAASDCKSARDQRGVRSGRHSAHPAPVNKAAAEQQAAKEKLQQLLKEETAAESASQSATDGVAKTTDPEVGAATTETKEPAAADATTSGKT